MNEYYSIFLNALRKGSVERKTDLMTGGESLFQDGTLLASLGSGSGPVPSLTETVKAEPHLVLFGSGHIGKALYNLAALQKMRITVLDDRSELLTANRFPLAERHVAPYDELLSKDYDAVSPAFVIFTHGHSFDTDCLRYTLKHNSSYIGMIGSKTKSAKAIGTLREEGFPEEALERIHTPIGLPIGAETPEEIAVSIMAEIIACYRKKKGFSTADPALLSIMTEQNGIEVRIVAKKGSAPRAVGSTMLVTENQIYGTIGGGAIEKTAIDEARRMLREEIEYQTRDYNLTSSGDIGMVCGGDETLLFRVF